jgi:hypothetical protein
MRINVLKIGLLLAATLGLGANMSAQVKPAITTTDRIRLAEAFSLNRTVSDRVWPGWSKIPFAILLVTPDFEFLIRHPAPSSDFTKIGYDSLLQSDVYFRKRTFPTTFLATFPAVPSSMIPTIVVGQAEKTEAATSTRWVVTLFHEHFHQLQSTQPNYYDSVKGLNLSHGDETGMWMLNYPFPYTTPEVQNRYADLSNMLVQALNAPAVERRVKIAAYLHARKQFEQLLTADDYRYLSFQFWQEGIARYTEYRVAMLAAASYKPTKSFRQLKDFTTFKHDAEGTHDRIIKLLLTQQLSQSKREVVYPFGAAEGLLLDLVNPAWRSQYFMDRFDLARFYRP